MRYTDQSLMPFGVKYKGQKLANIPASHFIWLYDTFGLQDGPLRVYIEENLEHLRMEAKLNAKNNKR